MPRLGALLAFVRSGDRICPEPRSWHRLFELLGEGAPVPLILGGSGAPDWSKRQRLEAQIRFAEEHGRLARVDRFLRRLPESEWYVEHEPDAEPLIYRLLDRPRAMPASPPKAKLSAQLAFTFG